MDSKIIIYLQLLQFYNQSNQSMNVKNAEISLILKKAGISPSPQRIAILRFMVEHRCHPSVDNIYTALSVEIPSLSRTTVYNTLWLLVEKGVIIGLDIDRSNTRFDYSESEHAHFRCLKCETIYDVPLEKRCSQMLQPGFQIKTVSINYIGICSNCNNIQNQTDKNA